MVKPHKSNCPFCGYDILIDDGWVSGELYCSNQKCGKVWTSPNRLREDRIALSLANNLARPYDKDWLVADDGLRTELEALVVAVKKNLLTEIVESAALAAEGRRGSGRVQEAEGIEAMIVWLNMQRELLD